MSSVQFEPKGAASIPVLSPHKFLRYFWKLAVTEVTSCKRAGFRIIQQIRLEKVLLSPVYVILYLRLRLSIRKKNVMGMN